MKFTPALPFSLLAVTCLAADNSSSSHSKVITATPQDVELIDRAFALGLALGESSDLIIADAHVANTISLRVSPDRLQEFIMANLEWKEKGQTFNPFNGLFDEKYLLSRLERTNSCMNFEFFQRVLSCCMLNSGAKISVDVAILKWVVGEIKRETKDYCIIDMKPNILVHVDPCIIGPVCSLSFYPQLLERCTEDILAVLDETQKLITSGYCDKEYLLGNFFPTLFTVSNLLVDGPIRRKTRLLYPMLYVLGCPEYKPSYEFVLASALTDEGVVADTEEKLLLSSMPKLHSLTSLPSLDPSGLFSNFVGTFLKANITEGIISWESSSTSSYDFISIPHKEPNQNPRLQIIFKIDPPPLVAKVITSCINLRKFYMLVEHPNMRRMILTFGLTILEDRY